MRNGLINDIIAAGFAISIDGDDIVLTPAGSDKISFNSQPLLQELKASKTEVVRILRQKLPPDDPYSTLIYTNPFPEGSKGARQVSFSAVMTVILQETVDQIATIYQGGQYHPSKDVRKAEQVVEGLWRKVLDGQARLEEFTKATEQWINICASEMQVLGDIRRFE